MCNYIEEETINEKHDNGFKYMKLHTGIDASITITHWEGIGSDGIQSFFQFYDLMQSQKCLSPSSFWIDKLHSEYSSSE